jgi:hypothetical protein
VQTSLWMQNYSVKPSDFREWFPTRFGDAGPDLQIMEWHRYYTVKAARYARFTASLYNLGVAALLAAVTTAALPPGNIPAPRYVVIGLAAVGFIIELAWIRRGRQPDTPPTVTD